MSTYDPVVRVEAAWDATPFTDVTAGSWSTVAEFRSGQWGRGGRSSPIDVYGAGSATLQFHDLDRTLDPLNTSSSLNGKLVPDVPVRVIANYSSTDYPLWYGYIDDYDTLFHVGLGEVTITATDGLRVLAGVSFERSVYETVILDDGPTAYWKLSGLGPIAADSSGNRYDATWSKAPAIKRAVAGPRPGGEGATFPARDFLAKAQTDSRPRITALPYSVEFWVETTATFAVPVSQGNGSDGHRFYIIVYDAVAGTPPQGVIEFSTMVDGADHRATSGWAPSNVTVNDGLPHHIVVTVDTDETIAIHIDGVSVGFVLASPTPLDGDAIVSIGNFFGDFSPLASTDATTISDVAFYDFVLSEDDVIAHYNAAWEPWDGDTTGARIERVLDFIGWPAAQRAIDSGESFLGPVDLAGRTALDIIQEAAQSEGGRFFQAANGDLTFHDALRFQSEPSETTSQVTFTDTTSGVLYEKGIRFRRSFRDVIDAMTVTRTGGTAQAAGSTTASHGRTLSTGHRDDNQARNLAERIVARYGDPVTRVDGWSTQPQVDGENFWPELLARELGDRITVEGTPLSQGSAISIEQHLDSISHEVGATFRMSFTGQPVDPNEGTYLTWGGDGATQGWATGSWR